MPYGLHLPCRREFGSERRAGVLVIVQEPGKEPGSSLSAIGTPALSEPMD